MTSDRMLPLEALRSCAAMIIMFHHFAEAFAIQIIPPIAGTPLFLLINGGGMVVVFFLLSGVVNCRPIFRDPGLWTLIRCLLRRWPQLMFPAVIASSSWR